MIWQENLSILIQGHSEKQKSFIRLQNLNKSASFPRISPDGKFLVFTLADYGTFPIWHHEADLYMLNLQSKISRQNGY